MEEPELALLQAFEHAFQAATNARLVNREEEIAFGHRRERLDALLTFKSHDERREIEVAVEAVNAAYPRDARRLIDYLTSFLDLRPATERPPAVPVVVANHLTAGAKEAFRDASINYFEASSGSLRFCNDTWLIDIERPSNSTASRKIGNVFSGAREQVVHASLMHWLRTKGDDNWLAGNELAVMADTSTFTVSKTLQELEKFDWVETTGSGPSLRRRIKREGNLLDAWAGEWTRRAHREQRTRWYTYAGARGDIVDRMLEKLAGRNGWAITGAAAANAAVPHLTAVDRIQIIVPPGLSEAWGQELHLERAERGANVTFIERSGASLMFIDAHPERPGSRFASPFVQYLDLLDGVGRNKELASEFRSRVLRMEPIEDD